MDQRVDSIRRVSQKVAGTQTMDGAGVRLSRVIGGARLPQLDPFLLLDHFRSDDPEDYIGGFPPHPHRGFETVTYLLEGRVRHRDSAGHSGVIESGGVQWMTAGRGVVHSEMPEQEKGRLSGLQLWINLPAARKMSPPRYQEYPRAQIPEELREEGIKVRVIAGTSSRGTLGPVTGLFTPVTYLDVSLPAGSRFYEPLPTQLNGFVYLIEGGVEIAGTLLDGRTLAVLGAGGRVEMEARQESRLLLVAGRPLYEPVARRGPFVMNNDEELAQAFRDYHQGRF